MKTKAIKITSDELEKLKGQIVEITTRYQYRVNAEEEERAAKHKMRAERDELAKAISNLNRDISGKDWTIADLKNSLALAQRNVIRLKAVVQSSPQMLMPEIEADEADSTPLARRFP